MTDRQLPIVDAPTEAGTGNPALLIAEDLLEVALPAAGEPDASVRPQVKTAFKGSGVSAVVATFKQNQALPDHKAGVPITVQCLTGKLLFTVGDRKVELTPGKIVNVPARVVHRVDALEESVVLLCLMTGND